MFRKLMKIQHSNGLKGQRAISPGQRPGYQISANIALKGQKNDGVNNSYALSGRIVTSISTQGVALGCDLIGLSGRDFPTYLNLIIKCFILWVAQFGNQQ